MEVKSALERFNEKFVVNEETGCWEWTASFNAGGYGQFWLKGKMRRAHRVAWVLYKGFIPDGLHMDHLCHTWAVAAGTCDGGPSCPHRACVNPEHLEPVTQQENIQRGGAGKYLTEKTHCPQGHAYVGDNLYVDLSGKRQCRTCRRDHSRLRMRRKREAKREAA